MHCDYKTVYNNTLCRVVKEAIKSVGANINPTSVQRVSRCLGPLKSTLASFDGALGITSQSGKHSSAKRERDRAMIAQELLSAEVFVEHQEENRIHKSFQHVKEPLFTNIDNAKLVKWLQRASKRILEFQ